MTHCNQANDLGLEAENAVALYVFSVELADGDSGWKLRRLGLEAEN